MSNCGCGKEYTIHMGCCQPVLGPVENYYTKHQIDKMIEDIEESGCCITADEVDEKIEDALEPYATEQWVLDRHYLTEHQSLSDYAPKAWVQENYATNVTLTQLIANLQNQINDLEARLEACCSQTGETLDRWLTMTGVSDYVCSGTTKMTKEAEEQSIDGGITWARTGNYRTGSTVLEANSTDCGYIPPLKFDGTLINSEEVKISCNGIGALTASEVYTSNFYTTIQIGDCVTEIGDRAFINQLYLDEINIPSGVTNIRDLAFADAGNHSDSTGQTITLNEGLVTIGESAFYGCRKYSTLVIPNSVTTIGDRAFSQNNATAITIGSGVTTIGTDALAKAKDLTTPYSRLVFLAPIPPTLDDYILNPLKGTYPIYVPSASVNAYKTAWSIYADRIFPIQ